MDQMSNYHAKHVSRFRIGDKFLGYSSSSRRWAVLEAIEYCPEDPTTVHFSPVGLLPKCEVNPRAWDIFIFQ